MPILSIKGDVLEYAIQNSKVLAPWIYNGFNTRWFIWNDLINKHKVELKLVHHENLKNAIDVREKPWGLGTPTVWEITNKPDWVLTYIYIFPNEAEKAWLDNFDDIFSEIDRCRIILNEFRINSISLIHIPASSGSQDDKLLSASYLVKAIRDWESQSRNDLTFYLVDRKNCFQPLLA